MGMAGCWRRDRVCARRVAVSEWSGGRAPRMPVRLLGSGPVPACISTNVVYQCGVACGCKLVQK